MKVTLIESADPVSTDHDDEVTMTDPDEVDTQVLSPSCTAHACSVVI